MKKCSVIFMLTENVLLSYELGIIGHIKEMEDMPDYVFFIADSFKKVILGPFVVTKPQEYRDQPIDFYRGVPVPRKKPCHWLMEFKPYPQLGTNISGILWNALADQMGLPRESWENMRQTRFTLDQLDFLFGELIRASNGLVVNGAVRIEDLRRSKEDWAAFVEGLVDDGQYDDDAYYSTYEGTVDLLFDGDYDIAEANMPED